MNDNIINQFKLLIKQIEFDIDFSSGKEQMVHMFRLKAINYVLNFLNKYTQKIISSKQLKGISGIGKKTLLRIDEILKTGKLSEIKITSDIDKYLNIITSLEDIIGIGRKKAYELFMKYHITSIEDLQQKYNSGEIQLPPNIVKGLQYVGKIEEKIPRAEIDVLSEILYNATNEIDPKLFGIICGSYRRQLPTSNDVDLIIVHTDMKTEKDTKQHNYLTKLIELLKIKHIIVDSITSDDVQTKYMGIYKSNEIYRRIDIRYIPYNSYYYAILYFTGSKNLNRKMRQIAIDMGYVLNEYGLYDENQKSLKVSSEKEIFELLGMEYLAPEQRDG